MSAPRTSIIMPVYNTADTVVRAIESVLAQTDTDFELIIINDRSPDNANSIIRTYLDELQDHRISYYVNEKNLGLAGARNQGLLHATGEWLAYLDSDDAYKPEFLATLHAAVTDDVDVIGGAHDLVHPDGTAQYRLVGQAGTYSGEEAMARVLSNRIAPFVWDKIFRRSVFQNLQFPLLNRVEDVGYCIPAFQKARTVRIIENSLNLYSINPASITWGSVPPFEDLTTYMEYVEEIIGTSHASEKVLNALAITRILNFLNSAQSVLRLNVDGRDEFLKNCQKAITYQSIFRALKACSPYGLAGAFFKTSPFLYGVIYKTYVTRTYGL